MVQFIKCYWTLFIALSFSIFFFAEISQASNYPLELVSPRQAGTYPSQDVEAQAMPSGHRIFKAYPGLEYNIRAVVIGGAYPYTFSLSNQPSGMTVSSATGVISWVNPSLGTVTPTLTVTDSENTTISAPWTINVAAAGFKFVDANNGSDSNNGDFEHPWQTLNKVKNSGSSGEIVYFKTGTYSTSGMYTNSVMSHTVDTTNFIPTLTSWETSDSENLTGSGYLFATGINAGKSTLITAGTVIDGRFRVTGVHANILDAPPSQGDLFGTGNNWTRTEFSGAFHPVQWIAYPGNNPVIDNNFQSVTSDWGAFVRISGNDTYPVYIDGFRVTNAMHIGLQVGGGSYPVFRNLTMNSNDVRYVSDGGNSAGIMFLSGHASQYLALQSNHFDGIAPGGFKHYSYGKTIWEDNIFENSGIGPDLKASCPRFDVRNNIIRNNDKLSQTTGTGLFGNMNGNADQRWASGEIRFNLFYNVGAASLELNQDGIAKEIHVYRNTLVGNVIVRNVSSDDGPFDFDSNVIINENSGSPPGSHISHEAVTDPSRINLAENLVGYAADGIVDESGKLQGTFRTNYLGAKGYEIGDDKTPAAPSGLSVN